jgi:hypothetical protein
VQWQTNAILLMYAIQLQEDVQIPIQMAQPVRKAHARLDSAYPLNNNISTDTNNYGFPEQKYGLYWEGHIK